MTTIVIEEQKRKGPPMDLGAVIKSSKEQARSMPSRGKDLYEHYRKGVITVPRNFHSSARKVRGFSL